MLYESLIKPLLFALSRNDAEKAHEWAILALRMLGKNHRISQTISKFMTIQDPVDLLGIHFPNRIGLAAGFDKNACAIWGLIAMGFGFLEVGTVTAIEQAGNTRPRIWRFPEDEAIINSMGFNNHGAEKMAQTLSRSKNLPIPIGISLGKSKSANTSNLEMVTNDYLHSFRLLHPFGDYFVLNISSPNTPGLRRLQGKEGLLALTKALQKGLALVANRKFQKPPLLVKIPPDLSLNATDDVLQVCHEQGICGIVATNTTIGREGLSVSTNVIGGLSGKPLAERAVQMVRHIRRQAPNLVIIGVGGISTIDDAQRMFDAGADLMQLYTGLIYKGPSLPRRLAKGIKSAPSRHRG